MLVTPLPKPAPSKKPRNEIGKERTRQIVRERDGDECLLCRRPGPGLHLHRVVYGKLGGYVPSNCVLLCFGCHENVVHGSKRVWQPLLMDYLNTEGEAHVEALRALRRRFTEWLREKHPTG